MMGMGELFKCAMCGEEFEGACSEEEVMAEARGHFGKSLAKEDCDVVCDGCFQKIHPEKFPHRVEEAATEVVRKGMGGQ
jgi:hypothetical protein